MPNGTHPASRRPSSSPGNPAIPRRGTGEAALAPRRSSAPAKATSVAKLVCTSGPKAGEEFVLEDAEVVIGRAVENAVSIPDTSVSRKHAVLRRVGSGWAVSDLGSGNGTQVNGESVQDEAVLRNGDVITCGDTEFTFANGGNTTDRRPVPRRTTSSPDAPVRRASTAARPRASRLSPGPDPEKKKRRRRLLLLTTVFALLVAASMGALKYKQLQAQQKERIEQAKIEAVRQQISEIFQEGKNLVRAGKWDEAKSKFEQIKEAAPEYPGVQDYLDRAQKEIPNQQALAAAEKAIAANQVAEAFEALNKVSSDTQQFEQVRKLRTQIDALQLKRVQEAEEMAQNASRAAQANKQDGIAQYKQVVAVVDDLLAANPENRDAKVLKDTAEQRIADLSYVPPPPPKPTAKPWEDATRQFIDGDLPGAFAIADACAAKGNKKCAEKRDLMRQFSEKYKGLEDLDAKGLTVLLNLNDKITDKRPSRFSKNAGTRAASIFFKSASAAKAAGQYGRAMEYAQRALQVDPGNVGATGIIADLRSKAKDVYLLAYSIKDTQPEEAAGKFKEVMQMAPESDELYSKAKYWLGQIAK